MKIKHRGIAAGLTVGVLAGGASGAIGATTSGSRIASASSTTSSRTTGGWDGYGYGWGGGGGWRDPTSGVAWSGWRSDTNIGGMRRTSFARSGREAAQIYLGLSASRLHSRLQSGKTLAEIASGQGKAVAGLESAIETALTDSVNADSALSASQKSSIIANLTNVVDSAVTDTWKRGPAGPMTSGGW